MGQIHSVLIEFTVGVVSTFSDLGNYLVGDNCHMAVESTYAEHMNRIIMFQFFP